MTYTETGTILDRILERSAADLKSRRSAVPYVAIEAAARKISAPLSLRACLDRPGMSVIAEIKRASPSRGTFSVEIDPSVVAAEYIAGGATAISILTDEPFFQGSLEDLEAAALIAHDSNPGVPILRKDFIIDPYQIAEARASGADAILLIVAALSDESLAELLSAAREWGMDALVEVHDEREMARAVAAGGNVIGINNRDLKTFSVDLAVTERLAPMAPRDVILVSESGVFGPADVDRLQRAGAHAVLVGESLITAADRAAAVGALRS